MNFIRSFSFTFGTKVVSLILVLLSRVVLARLLGPTGLGSFGSALNLTTVISRWGSVGIAPATQFMSGKYQDSKNPILTYTVLLSLILGLGNMLVAHVFAEEIANWQFAESSSAQGIFRQLLPFLPIIILSMALPIMLLGAGRYQAYSLTQIIPLLIQTLILLSAFWQAATMKTVVIAQISYWLSTVIIGFTLTGFPNFQLGFDRGLLHTYINLSLSLWPLVVFQFGMARLPVLIGSQYLDSPRLGHYLLALNIAEAFLIVHGSIAPIVFNQKISKLAGRETLARTIRFSNLLLLSALIMTCLIGKPIFTMLFGYEFIPSWTLLLKLFPWVMVHGMVNIFLNYLIAAERKRLVYFIQFLSFVGLIISGTILCSLYGSDGLCMAALCSSLTAFIFAYVVLINSKTEKITIAALFIPVSQDWRYLYALLSRLKTSKRATDG
ncbi:lipopolysaccharide biosynthesis protein [Dyadobacter sp. CY312]|uniref:lipopolysaccharide biosynthesis protein n=1 Tax=Dyadobacter sp. CY312 TaxID=2907303 RepID=UPI001F2E32CE|nr:oligosaccharide flippase family protein [Dyadobacter sp. CY312]MCE7041965.1 oligosaccharide flippase family protein [Dyadobacter sp. CY312]